MKKYLTRLAVLLALLSSGTAVGQGINTNVALPVAQGEGIWRTQLRYVHATDDLSPMTRARSLIAPQTLVFGFTSRLTAFATLPVLARRWTEVAGQIVSRDSALGDFRLLARYMLIADDYAPLSTRRVAILGGLKFPTGSNGFGTPSFDPIFGAVATWAAKRHELDADGLYTLGTRRHGFETGDRFRYDVAYRYRLWPARFGRRPLQLNGLVELNGSWMGGAREDGRSVPDSGGHLLFLSPGVQLVATRWLLEASVQVPIAQDLRGAQPEADVVAVLSVRIPFALY